MRGSSQSIAKSGRCVRCFTIEKVIDFVRKSCVMAAFEEALVKKPVTFSSLLVVHE